MQKEEPITLINLARIFAQSMEGKTRDAQRTLFYRSYEECRRRKPHVSKKIWYQYLADAMYQQKSMERAKRQNAEIKKIPLQ